MVRIYTLTLAPSLDSATITPQIYPEGKLRCTAPVFEPGGGGINVARAIAHLGGSATAIFPAGGATGEHLVSLLADENVPVATVEAKDWTRQNLHVHVEASGEQYRFVMPGAALNEDEFRQLEEQVLEIESGAILVISGSLPPGVKLEKLTQLISAAQNQGIRCIIDSSGEALSAALAIGNIELVKPNQKELSALVNRELTQPDDVRKAAHHIDHDMSKVEHDRINAFLVFLPGIHKFQQRNQCRDQCRYKNHPTQNPFQNSNASSLLIRHEFSLIKTRRFT